MVGFSTIEDAAAAALVHAVARSRASRRQSEYMGAVYEQDGRYYYTEPRSLHSRTGGATRLQIPTGSLRALYHNHPPGGGNDRFSPEDIKMARKLGVPSFVSIAPTKKRGKRAPGAESLRAYYPGQTTDDRGVPVLAEIPIDVIVRDLMVRLLNRDPNDPRGLYRESPNFPGLLAN